MKGRPNVKVKFERSSTLTCTRALPNIASILFKRVNLRVCGRKNYATVEIHLREFNNGTILFTKKRYICCSAHAQELMI